MQRDDLEKIIETIARRVQSELKQGGGTSGPSARTATTNRGDSELARFIDHTMLKPEVTQAQLKTLCDEARDYGFYSVCVNSANVPYCRQQLAGSNVKVVAVVGFPLGAASTGSKVYEAREAVQQGASEIDMVMNIGEMKSKDYAYVAEDIRQIVAAISPAPVKVIIETGMLTLNEKIVACALAKAAGAAFVKTSTGFAKGGATVEDIALMKEVVGSSVQVKASGGVRDNKTAKALIKAGATRIGASASIAIVTGQTGGGKGY